MLLRAALATCFVALSQLSATVIINQGGSWTGNICSTPRSCTATSGTSSYSDAQASVVLSTTGVAQSGWVEATAYASSGSLNSKPFPRTTIDSAEAYANAVWSEIVIFSGNGTLQISGSCFASRLGDGSASGSVQVASASASCQAGTGTQNFNLFVPFSSGTAISISLASVVATLDSAPNDLGYGSGDVLSRLLIQYSVQGGPSGLSYSTASGEVISIQGATQGLPSGLATPEPSYALVTGALSGLALFLRRSRRTA